MNRNPNFSYWREVTWPYLYRTTLRGSSVALMGAISLRRELARLVQAEKASKTTSILDKNI
jgi:hypothetical protein